MLPEYRAQCRLRELTGGLQKLGHLNDRLFRIDDAEIDHGVDLHRHIVTGNHVLRRYVHHDRAQIHPHHLLHARDDQYQPGSLDLPEAAKHEHHRALVLAHDSKGRNDQQYDDQGNAAESHSECHR